VRDDGQFERELASVASQAFEFHAAADDRSLAGREELLQSAPVCGAPALGDDGVRHAAAERLCR